jgi:FKBP-type peptidyl-prolyl cis-trans isomerase FklB
MGGPEWVIDRLSPTLFSIENAWSKVDEEWSLRLDRLSRPITGWTNTMRWAVMGGALLATAGFGWVWAQESEVPLKDAPKLETVNQKASYIIGHKIGSQLKREAIEPDVDALLIGIKEAIAGKKMGIPTKDAQAVMQEFSRLAQAAQEEKKKGVGAKNLDEAKKFLAGNTKKDGVITTKSGLQYEVIKEGAGAIPKASDKVRTHYKGTLLDGTVFDSSYDRGEPAEFPVGDVIKGWVEALQLMKVGSKWKLYIPPDLGYGERGAGEDIGPNAMLTFEIELLDIVE